jgi:hypothetical protein
MKRSIEELLDAPYWIVDILPKQVPKNSPGQYFAIEKYYLAPERFPAVKQKHIDTVLKLNCYADISLDEETEINPPPEEIARAMRGRCVHIMIGDSMIVSEPDETYLTLYGPDRELLGLTRKIASAEGLFLWKPTDQG